MNTLSSTSSGESAGVPADASPKEVGPLDAQHFQTIREAKARRATLDRAVAVATFNGWSVGALAVLSVPFAFFSMTALVMCLGLGAVAYQEFKGRSMLRQLDPRGPRLLGMNQIGLGALIVGYCLWSLFTAVTGPNPYAQYLDAEPALGRSLGSIDELYRIAAFLVYGGTILLTLLYQGLMAWYCFSRAKHLRAYLHQTPDWVTQLERAAS